jgi:hypothetical protein
VQLTAVGELESLSAALIVEWSASARQQMEGARFVAAKQVVCLRMCRRASSSADGMLGLTRVLALLLALLIECFVQTAA